MGEGILLGEDKVSSSSPGAESSLSQGEDVLLQGVGVKAKVNGVSAGNKSGGVVALNSSSQSCTDSEASGSETPVGTGTGSEASPLADDRKCPDAKSDEAAMDVEARHHSNMTLSSGGSERIEAKMEDDEANVGASNNSVNNPLCSQSGMIGGDEPIMGKIERFKSEHDGIKKMPRSENKVYMSESARYVTNCVSMTTCGSQQQQQTPMTSLSQSYMLGGRGYQQHQQQHLHGNAVRGPSMTSPGLSARHPLSPPLSPAVMSPPPGGLHPNPYGLQCPPPSAGDFPPGFDHGGHVATAPRGGGGRRGGGGALSPGGTASTTASTTPTQQQHGPPAATVTPPGVQQRFTGYNMAAGYQGNAMNAALPPPQAQSGGGAYRQSVGPGHHVGYFSQGNGGSRVGGYGMTGVTMCVSGPIRHPNASGYDPMDARLQQQQHQTLQQQAYSGNFSSMAVNNMNGHGAMHGYGDSTCGQTLGPSNGQEGVYGVPGYHGYNSLMDSTEGHGGGGGSYSGYTDSLQHYGADGNSHQQQMGINNNNYYPEQQQQQQQQHQQQQEVSSQRAVDSQYNDMGVSEGCDPQGYSGSYGISDYGVVGCNTDLTISSSQPNNNSSTSEFGIFTEFCASTEGNFY